MASKMVFKFCFAKIWDERLQSVTLFFVSSFAKLCIYFVMAVVRNKSKSNQHAIGWETGTIETEDLSRYFCPIQSIFLLQHSLRVIPSHSELLLSQEIPDAYPSPALVLNM